MTLPFPRPEAVYSKENEARWRDQIEREIQSMHDKRRDLRVDAGKNFILVSPDGTPFVLSIDNTGKLTVKNHGTDAAVSQIISNGQVSGLGWGATATEAQASNARSATFAENLIPSTRFPDATKWQIAVNSTGLTPVLTREVDANGEAYLQARVTGTVASQQVLYAANNETLNKIAVSPGAKYELSADVWHAAASSAYGEVLIYWRNSAGSTIGSQVSAGTNTIGNAWVRIGAILTAPSAAVSVLFGARIVNAPGQINPLIALRRPLVTAARSDQAALSEYVPKPE